jgi:putative transposase
MGGKTEPNQGDRMSKGQRRKHSAEFKARIALEAIKGIKTVAQIAADHHLHPVQVTQWKTQMLEAAPTAFERGASKVSQGREQQQQEKLERKIGQLVVEVDWLKKSARSWGSIHEEGHGGQREAAGLAEPNPR